MFSHTSRRAISLALLLVASITFQSFGFMATSAVYAQKKPAKAPAKPAKPVPVPNIVSPVITATKVDAYPDPNADGKADPGETITYTINISNTGTGDATGVMFTDTIDPNTTLVAMSGVLATGDRYNTIGNVNISVPVGQGLLANDKDITSGNNTGMTASAGPTITQGGTVAVSSDGSFTYDPPLGFNGSDTFTYTATTSTGKTATGTATITVSGRIWFINNNVGACISNCDGRLSHPFQTLAAFNALNDNGVALSHPKIGDSIFLYESSATYTAPVTLLNNQLFIGQDATASLISISGLTQPSGTDPLPAMNSGNGVFVTIISGGNGINLGAGNTLRGFTVGTTTGTKISGNTFGTLTVGNNVSPDVTLNGNGKALDLNGGTFAASSKFAAVASSASGSQGINLANIAGTVDFGSTTISGNTTQCILVGTSTANITFGNTSCSSGTDGVSLSNNSAGTLTFGSLTISGNSGVGFLHAVGGGAVTVNGATTITNPG